MIEILHTRDSDGGCEHVVFVDGVKVGPEEVWVEDVDPGRGYTREDWNENTEWVSTKSDYSPAFRDAVIAERNETSSPYIEEN